MQINGNAVARLLGATAMGALGAASGYFIAGPDAAIPAGLVSFVVMLPFRWTHPHRWRQLERMEPKSPPTPTPLIVGLASKLLPATKPSGYMSFYCDPRSGRISYLRWHPAGNACQESWSEGHEYVDSEAQATVWENADDAKAVTPVYDGSIGIETRAGIKPVYGRKPTRTHLDCCRTCREGGDCGAHLTFAPEKPVAAPPVVEKQTIVQSLFRYICPDEQTQTIMWHDEPGRSDVRHFWCKSCGGVWEVRLANARHMRDYAGFDVEKTK